MTTSSQTKSDFMAAEEIKGILHGRERVEQERILRWVTESLGIPLTAAGGPPFPPGTSSSLGTPPTAPVLGQARDIKTFVQQKQPKSDNQFATVVAFFYRFVAPEADRKDTITTEDLQTAARQARGFGFKVPSVTMKNAVQQGYLDRAGRGAFRVNAVGENLVAMALPGAGAEGNTSRARGRARPRSSKKATGAKKRGKKARAT